MEKDWGDYKYEFTVKEKKDKPMGRMHGHGHGHGYGQAAAMGAAYSAVYGIREEHFRNAAVSVGREREYGPHPPPRSGSTAADETACPKCTYANKPTANICKMCGAYVGDTSTNYHEYN